MNAELQALVCEVKRQLARRHLTAAEKIKLQKRLARIKEQRKRSEREPGKTPR